MHAVMVCPELQRGWLNIGSAWIYPAHWQVRQPSVVRKVGRLDSKGEEERPDWHVGVLGVWVRNRESCVHLHKITAGQQDVVCLEVTVQQAVHRVQVVQGVGHLPHDMCNLQQRQYWDNLAIHRLPDRTHTCRAIPAVRIINVRIIIGAPERM